jgi:hypothetical protein
MKSSRTTAADLHPETLRHQTFGEAFRFWLKLGFYQFRRTDRPNRYHARRTGGKKEMDKRGALSDFQNVKALTRRNIK